MRNLDKIGASRMNVLVACEESQRVCIAFREKGHNAFSCDIQECSGGHPEWHIQGDVLKILNPKHIQIIDNNSAYGFYGIQFQTMDGASHKIYNKWDLIIAHPPCTYLSNAGNAYFNIDRYGEKAIERYNERTKAAIFFMNFVLADCKCIAVENPVGYMNTHYRKPNQIIQPYYFATSEFDEENYHLKTTCLWLKNLPVLKRTSQLCAPQPIKIDNTKRKKKRYFTDTNNGSYARSKTFSGIAKAMAEQWG